MACPTGATGVARAVCESLRIAAGWDIALCCIQGFCGWTVAFQACRLQLPVANPLSEDLRLHRRAATDRQRRRVCGPFLTSRASPVASPRIPEFDSHPASHKPFSHHFDRLPDNPSTRRGQYTIVASVHTTGGGYQAAGGDRCSSGQREWHPRGRRRSTSLWRARGPERYQGHSRRRWRS